MFDKPERMRKRLSGLNQKVSGQVRGLQRSPAADVVPPAQRRDLTRWGIDAEHGKPVALPPGKRAVRRADGAAGRGSGSKPRPACNGLDRGCAARQHHPTRKRADFPEVRTPANAQPTGVRQRRRNVGPAATVGAGAAATTESFRELALGQYRAGGPQDQWNSPRAARCVVPSLSRMMGNYHVRF
jgi:hypothetical protein